MLLKSGSLIRTLKTTRINISGLAPLRHSTRAMEQYRVSAFITYPVMPHGQNLACTSLVAIHISLQYHVVSNTGIYINGLSNPALQLTWGLLLSFLCNYVANSSHQLEAAALTLHDCGITETFIHYKLTWTSILLLEIEAHTQFRSFHCTTLPCNQVAQSLQALIISINNMITSAPICTSIHA